MLPQKNKLDNPVWYSLVESHNEFAINYENIKFYHPDYCPFGAFIKKGYSANCLEEYAKIAPEFYVVGSQPDYPSVLNMKKELVCNQMILENIIQIDAGEEIVELKFNNIEELFRLVNLVQPGFFKSKTSALGSYFGIFKNKKLVAVTGERMKMNSFTEISAVVTHPDHTGKGYAGTLIAYTAGKIFSENKLPYLHVAETNIGAIKLYEKLGFTTRRKISFWNFEKN